MLQGPTMNNNACGVQALWYAVIDVLMFHCCLKQCNGFFSNAWLTSTDSMRKCIVRISRGEENHCGYKPLAEIDSIKWAIVIVIEQDVVVQRKESVSAIVGLYAEKTGRLFPCDVTISTTCWHHVQEKRSKKIFIMIYKNLMKYIMLLQSRVI